MITPDFLSAFSQENVKDFSLAFFEKLNYSSEKNIASPELLAALQHEEVAKAHLLFQLTDEEIQTQFPMFESAENAIDNSIIFSYLFVALELQKSAYSRTDLADILRKINKKFPMPVLILFQYGDYLTLGAIHRRLHKKDSSKDVLEKVTLIKDISIYNPHRAHLDILNQLAFKNLSPHPNNFVELHQIWQKILDISALNKKFYAGLSELFTQLVGGTRGKTIFNRLLMLPSVQDEKIIKEFAVRLIGRLLFCWFLQKKTSPAGVSLIPADILSYTAILNKKSSIDYYHDTLEPLFFEALNKPLAERKDDFKINYWSQIPFLNGGLFEPHFHDFYDKNNCTLNTLRVPDEWLQELIAFFERYHFTIEENTPLDVQVAIDPEMLGQIFENLLAEINPETGESARKATGSYYTPREIVDYMVDESLIAYFSTQCPDLSVENLRQLLAYDSSENPFNADDSTRLLSAINQIKMLDPACGSGAFPMGILQKLTLLLSRLDNDCSQWLIFTLNGIPDVSTRRLMREKLEGERDLWNYARKLGILGKCIYGVDIQVIAVEISRLRCFLSLIVDEKVEDNKPNRSIIPLPNLNFKFVCANMLIGFSNENYQRALFEKDDNVQKLADLRANYFAEQDLTQKKILQNQFEAIQSEMFKQWLSWNQGLSKKDSETSQLTSWKPFADESCAWFDSSWMFGIKKGDEFDIVIGNPPYIRQEAIKHLKEDLKSYSVFTGTSDLFTYFYECGFNVLKENGTLAFITSNKWMRAKYGEKLRDFFLTKTQLSQLIDFKGKQIFDATVDSNILLFKKQFDNKNHSVLVGEILPNPESPLKPLAQHFLNKKSFVLGDESIQALKAKIEAIGTPLKNWDVKIYRGVTTGFNEAFIIDSETKNRLCAEDPKSAEIIKPILRGRDIKRYAYEWAGLWIITTFPALNVNIDEYPAVKKYFESFGNRLHQTGEKGSRKKTGNEWFETQDQIAYWQEFEKEKIVWIELVDQGRFAFDKGEFYTEATTFMITGKYVKYLLFFLNSKLISWYFDLICAKSGVGTNRWKKIYIEQIPIPKIPESQQQPFVELIEQILALKQQGKNTQTLEKEIDDLVYRLYDLSVEEINLIEQAN